MLRQLIRPARPLRPAVYYAPRRLHSTTSLEETVSNDGGRLRLGEEKYAADLSFRFPTIVRTALAELEQETKHEFRNAHMMVPETQSKLLHQLVRILRPRRVLEIGTFTGYSTLAMASALSTGAGLISLDRNKKAQEIAQRHLIKAHLQDRVELRHGRASDLLKDLFEQDPHRQFDLIFLDANKSEYIPYYEFVMDNDMLSDNGVIIADNVLFFGQVHRLAGYEPVSSDASKNILKTAQKAHKFNEHVIADSRVEVVVLPVFDGVSIIRKVHDSSAA